MHISDCVIRNEVVTEDDAARANLWDEIIVPASVKERLVNHALLSLTLRPQLKFEVTALHGLITLYGPPGTGKTSLARALPSQLAPVLAGRAVRVLEVNPHGLMSAEHGQSQQRVHSLLAEYIPALANDCIPTVVVLDEVESIAVARSAASLAANPADVHRATDAVLTALDHNAQRHSHLLFVATSNFTSALDEAFLSRSDAAVLVPNPTVAALLRILQSTLSHLGDVYPALNDLTRAAGLSAVAEAANGMDGRRARKIVFEALALQRDTVIDPGSLTVTSLLDAVKLWRAGNEAFLDQKASDAAA